MYIEVHLEVRPCIEKLLIIRDLLVRGAGRLAVQRGAGGRFWRKAATKTAVLAEMPDALRAVCAPVADFPARRPATCS